MGVVYLFGAMGSRYPPTARSNGTHMCQGMSTPHIQLIEGGWEGAGRGKRHTHNRSKPMETQQICSWSARIERKHRPTRKAFLQQETWRRDRILAASLALLQAQGVEQAAVPQAGGTFLVCGAHGGLRPLLADVVSLCPMRQGGVASHGRGGQPATAQANPTN